MKTGTSGKVVETKEAPLDSRGAQRPLKTSDSAGDFLPPTPDFTMPDSQRDGDGSVAEQPPRRVEKRPDIGPYLEGKLSLVLALGLSQREAEYWVDHSQSTISRLVRLDENFAEEIHRDTQLVRHPLLRVYMASYKSWRASKGPLRFLKARTGEASVADLLAEFPRLFQKLRPTLFNDEAYWLEFENKYPIGDGRTPFR